MSTWGEAGARWGDPMPASWGGVPIKAKGYGDGLYGGDFYGVAIALTEPQMTVEVLVNGQWVDTTCDVRSIAIGAGRSSYLDAFAAGTATITYDNRDGRYSGWSVFGLWAEASPYRVDVPIRIRILGLDGITRYLFTGTTDTAVDEWPDKVTGLASVAATDAFKTLARHRGLARAAVGDGELTGARVNRLLDDAAYTGPRAIDAGLVSLQATTLDGVTVDLLRQVGESEWGWIYVAGDGRVLFRQRDVIQTDPRMINVQWTLVDEHDDSIPRGVCYSDVKLPVDDDKVLNVAQVTPPGVATQTAQDAASVAWFGPRTWSRTDLPIKQAADALSLAQLVVLQQGAAVRRVTGITFPAGASPAAYACAGGVQIGDRVRFVRHYPDGYVLDSELLVNSIDHAIEADGSGYPRDWLVTLGTADALNVRDYGQWDVGEWDTDEWGV